MEKIVIDDTKCIGCGLCVNNNPNYIEFNEMGLAEPLPTFAVTNKSNCTLAQLDTGIFYVNLFAF